MSSGNFLLLLHTVSHLTGLPFLIRLELKKFPKELEILLLHDSIEPLFDVFVIGTPVHCLGSCQYRPLLLLSSLIPCRCRFADVNGLKTRTETRMLNGPDP